MSYAYTPVAEDVGQNKFVYLCCAEGCGADLGMIKKKFCPEHLSAKGRAAITTDNEEINKNLAKLAEKHEWIYAI